MLVTCLACTGVRTHFAVRSFAKNAGGTVADLYQPEPSELDGLTKTFLKEVGAVPEYGKEIEALYAADDNVFRFVVAQKTTPNHQQLNARVDQLFFEGIDPAPYRIDQRNKLEKALADSLTLLDSLQGTALDEAESAVLTDALSDAGFDDLSPTGILTFAGKPGNEGKFPILQKMVSEAEAAAKTRDEAIIQLELIDATNFARLTLVMGMPHADLDDFWAKSKTDMSGTLQSMIPVSPHYPPLVKALAQFRELAKKTQPEQFTMKIHAKKGSINKPLVMRFQERLQFEGFWDGPIDGEFDDAFEEAVKRYQSERQVTTDGKIERATIERLNVPMSDRVKQLKLALEKLRNSPTRGGDYFVRVNLGTQEVEVYRDGGTSIVRRHRIIIGNRVTKNHTPEFSDEIEMIVANPPWLVPQRIIKDEMLPEFLEDEEYFKKMGYIAKIKYAEDGSFEKVLAVTQPPGHSNALGRVKFLFPNEHAVYLHDTPNKYLFDRSVRTFSHGCMRLENPIDLARFLLETDNPEALAEFDMLLEKRIQKTIYLNKNVAIHIVYVTVSVNDEGRVVFSTDPYNRDAELMEALSAD